MTDFLDREAVIALFDKYHPYMGTRVLSYEKALKALPTVEAIPVEFIKDLYKKAIEYRDGLSKYSPAWDRANENAIGLNSVLQVWEDRHG